MREHARSRTLGRILAGKITVARHTGCWVMSAHLKPQYRIIRLHGRAMAAHRASWMARNGPIPAGLLVCHGCDNPPCLRPSHLFLGTHADNAMDRALKKRGWPPPGTSCNAGERNGSARLSADAALSIRASSEQGIALAARYGVSPAMISRIRRGRRWRAL